MRGALVVLVAGGVALAAPPTLLLEGKLTWTLPAATPTLSSTVGLTWTAAGWEWTGKAGFEAGAWKTLAFTGSGKLGELEISPALSFDPQGPAFQAVSMSWKHNFLGLAAEGVARLEGKGFGWGLTFLGPKDGFIERVRLRFNLKRFLDQAQEATFAPSFSFGEVRFRVALPCCVERLRGWLQFSKAGFAEVGVSFPLPLPRESGLLASGVVRFTLDKKSVFLGPGLVYELPPCVEAFLALDWDQGTATLRGIKVYAVGFRCEVGEVRLRALATFEPIGLVKPPYREALWLAWEATGCCGPLRFNLGAYFGEGSTLFGLGEVEVGVEFALAPAFVLGLGAELPVAGSPKLALSWKVAL